MSSINDVLKEKFGVTGSNIAETLSKIEASGGGSGGSGSGLIVNVQWGDSEYSSCTVDRTVQEILSAAPFVLFHTEAIVGPGEDEVEHYYSQLDYFKIKSYGSDKYKFRFWDPYDNEVAISAEQLTDYPQTSSDPT